MDLITRSLFVLRPVSLGPDDLRRFHHHPAMGCLSRLLAGEMQVRPCSLISRCFHFRIKESLLQLRDRDVNGADCVRFCLY